MSDLKHTLSTPITAGDTELKEIVFREPLGGDIAAVGLPAQLNLGAEPPTMDINARAMTAMMARLANVPPSSIGQMLPGDWTACAYMLADRFMPGPSRT